MGGGLRVCKEPSALLTVSLLPSQINLRRQSRGVFLLLNPTAAAIPPWGFGGWGGGAQHRCLFFHPKGFLVSFLGGGGGVGGFGAEHQELQLTEQSCNAPLAQFPLRTPPPSSPPPWDPRPPSKHAWISLHI